MGGILVVHLPRRANIKPGGGMYQGSGGRRKLRISSELPKQITTTVKSNVIT